MNKKKTLFLAVFVICILTIIGCVAEPNQAINIPGIDGNISAVWRRIGIGLIFMFTGVLSFVVALIIGWGLNIKP